MTFQNSHVRFYVSLIGSGEGRHTTRLLKFVLLLSTSQTDWKQSSDILSDISFDILSDISSDILSDISFDILSDISSDILSDISFDILSDISSDMLSSDTRLRSGAEHWPHRIAAEVRRGTLNTHHRKRRQRTRRRKRRRSGGGGGGKSLLLFIILFV